MVKEAKIRADIQTKKWEEQRKKWKEEEENRLKEKAVKDSQDTLLQLIDRWAEVKKFEVFFQEIESSLATLPHHERDRLKDRLKLAKEFIGPANALKTLTDWKTPDELLMKDKH